MVKEKFDPNNYYKLLGLDPNVAWLMGDIRKAYRKKVFLYHPDSGNLADDTQFDLIQVAYSVIGKPETRKKYDELGPLDIWPDKNVLSRLMKNPKIQEAIKLDSRKPKKPLEGYSIENTQDYTVHHNYPVMYHFEGEVLPSIEIRMQWIDMITRAFWISGYTDEIVRVGFASRPEIIREQWGSVIMVSGKPDENQAMWLVLELKFLEKQPKK